MKIPHGDIIIAIVMLLLLMTLDFAADMISLTIQHVLGG
jgi:hypothetical protein